MERKIGSVISIGGKRQLVVTATDTPTCEGCYYEATGPSRRDCIFSDTLGECHHIVRTDKENVIFKLKTN